MYHHVSIMHKGEKKHFQYPPRSAHSTRRPWSLALHVDSAQEGRSRSRPPYLYGCLPCLRLIHTIRSQSIEPCSSLYPLNRLGEPRRMPRLPSMGRHCWPFYARAGAGKALKPDRPLSDRPQVTSVSAAVLSELLLLTTIMLASILASSNVVTSNNFDRERCDGYTDGGGLAP
jgi:hypothetical protein